MANECKEDRNNDGNVHNVSGNGKYGKQTRSDGPSLSGNSSDCDSLDEIERTSISDCDKIHIPGKIKHLNLVKADRIEVVEVKVINICIK